MRRKLYSQADLALIFLRQLVLPALLLYYFGITYGLVSIIGLKVAKKILLAMFFPHLEPLTTMDEFFLLDWDQNRANILTLMKLERV
jgi:hypothetical protein